MATFIILAIILTALVLGLMLMPFFRGEDGEMEQEDADAAIYRSQLEELDRDLAEGTINPEEAKAARAEISRRLLAVTSEDSRATSSGGMAPGTRKLLAGMIACLIPLAGLMLYLGQGSPGYSAQPYQGEQGEADLWIEYGQAQIHMRKFDEAAGAFAKAISLAEPSADLYEMYGEALLFAGNGEISDATIGAFQKALEMDPTRVRSRYVLAEWLYQNGRPEDGVRILIDLLEETDDADFRAHLDTRIQEAIAELKEAAERGEDITQRPRPQAARPERPSGLANLSEDQRAQVEGMVAGLAARLEEDPNDLEGWLRLIRSYSVMGRPEEARKAVDTATFTFLADREALEQILALVEQLGLAGGPELPEDAKILKEQMDAEGP